MIYYLLMIQEADGWPSLVLNNLPPFSLMLIPKTCLPAFHVCRKSAVEASLKDLSQNAISFGQTAMGHGLPRGLPVVPVVAVYFLYVSELLNNHRVKQTGTNTVVTASGHSSPCPYL